MNKTELLALLDQYSTESASEMGAAVELEATTGYLFALTKIAENSATGFRLSIEMIDREVIDMPGALYALGGAAKLEEQRGNATGPANTALAALATYASEMHLDHDVAAGAGSVAVAGAGAPETGAVTGAGTAAAAVTGAGAVEEGADVAAGEGTVV